MDESQALNFEKWEDDIEMANEKTGEEKFDVLFSTQLGNKECHLLHEYVAQRFSQDRQNEEEEKKRPPLPLPDRSDFFAMTSVEKDEYRQAYMKYYKPPPGKKLVMFTTGFATTSFPEPILESVDEIMKECLSGTRSLHLEDIHFTWKNASSLQRHYDMCPCQVCQSISFNLKNLLAKRRYTKEFYSQDSLIELAIKKELKRKKPLHEPCGLAT